MNARGVRPHPISGGPSRRSAGTAPSSSAAPYHNAFTCVYVATLGLLLNGIGAGLQPGTMGSLVQVSAVLFVQATHAAWIFYMKPSVDRIMNTLVGTQFLLEACQTALLLLVNLYPPKPLLEAISLALAIASVLAPVTQRFYDAVVVQLIKRFYQGGFKPKAAFFAMLGLLVFIPSVVFKFLGIETRGMDKFIEHGGETYVAVCPVSAD